MKRLALAALAAVLGCGEPSTPEAPLEAEAGAAIVAFVGEVVRLDASASAGAARFAWDAGDGQRSEPSESPVFEVIYSAPGRYQAVLTAFDLEGRSRRDGAAVTVVRRPIFEPSSSGPVVRAGRTLAVVEADADLLSLFRIGEGGALTLLTRRETCRSPRSVTPFAGGFAVSCELEDAVELHPLDGGTARRTALGRGSRPFGTAARGETLAVTLGGTGELALLAASDGALEEVGRLHAVRDARAVASLPDGRFVVSRWRSGRDGGQLAFVDPGSLEVTLLALEVDPQISSDTETGGTPNYLESLSVSPAGDELLVAGLHANVFEGDHLSGRPLAFDRMVRAVVFTVDLPAMEERFERRRQFDSRGFASAVRHTRRGDFAFVAARGARSVERLDRLGQTHAGSIQGVGHAPDGIALTEDDAFVFVHASLSRSIEVYDVRDFRAAPALVGSHSTVDAEPLSPELLRGKRLFNDASDPRLGKEGYMACAHCHLDGRSDGQVWDFTDRGEGLRRTPSLLGGAGAPPLHWTGNFDEVQDFEHDIRAHFGGRGLLDDPDYSSEGRDHPLGGPKAGLSEDLDALAAYVSSLDEHPKSPHRAEDGSLTPEAALGKAVFEDPATGCRDCHVGPALARSEFSSPGEPLLFDVGTMGPGSGGRLGGDLVGFDTPTLHGLFDAGPFLHDGSAADLREVLTVKNPSGAHGSTSHLDDAALDALIAYLLSLDGEAD